MYGVKFKVVCTVLQTGYHFVYKVRTYFYSDKTGNNLYTLLPALVQQDITATRLRTTTYSLSPEKQVKLQPKVCLLLAVKRGCLVCYQ